MSTEPVFHEGELAVQERAGEAAIGSRNGGMIEGSIMPAARGFVAAQRMVVAGSVSSEGDVWASVIMGEPGFMQTLDGNRIDFDLGRVHQDTHDPFWTNIQQDPRAGLLMIELVTRRRLRVNGRFDTITADGLSLQVDESYPNCPKYIQRRQLTERDAPGGSTPRALRTGHTVNTSIASLITSADTLFVASMAPAGGVDASHRGGPPGFVRIVDEQTLRIPDYAGNSMFNTLGNFASYARAGLTFVDFDAALTLQMVGRPEVRWDLADAPDETGGTGRYWDFTIDHWQETTLPAWAEWDLLDYSPFNPKPAQKSNLTTGSESPEGAAR